jgi:PBP1b-binding outer membrane lipoprotein LpoB
MKRAYDRRVCRASILLTVAAVALVLAGCDDIGLTSGETGSRNVVTEIREVSTFSGIDVGSAIKVEVSVDPTASQSVSVTYDDNIIDKLVTRVSNDTLILEFDGSVNLTGSADRVIAITVAKLETLEASGASNVEATGSAGALRLDASGASRVDLRDLEAVDMEIDISGASKVDLFVTGTVSGDVSGASNVNIYGNPVSALIDSSGASTVDVKN